MGDPANDNRKRDASSLRVLGAFFAILGGLVLVGTLWALDDRRGAIVNLASGAILVAVGGGMIVVARAMARRQLATNGTRKKSRASVDQQSPAP